MWLDDHWALTLHTPAGAVPVTLRMAGAHNAKNALAAATCALAAGAPLGGYPQGPREFRAGQGSLAAEDDRTSAASASR